MTSCGIDHFRGFDEYFAIPYGDTTAANGKWMPGPGMDIMNAIKERFGDRPIIAEGSWIPDSDGTAARKRYRLSGHEASAVCI